MITRQRNTMDPLADPLETLPPESRRPLDPFAAVRLRLASITFGLALLFALGGLYAIDQMLSQASRTDANVEARVSAAVLEEFLAIHAQALQSMRGLYLDTTRHVSDEEFHTLSSSITEYATSLHRIWVADSAGVIRHQARWDSTTPPLTPGLSIDTVTRFNIRDAVARARRTRRIQLSAPGRLLGGQRGFMIIEPLYVGNRLMGFAGESITSDALLQSVQQRLPRARGRLALLAGSDTVASSIGTEPTTGGFYRAVADLHVPGAVGWHLVVVRPTRDERVRVVLWGVGLALLGALLVGLLQERRHARRLAERSAELERLSAELLEANRAKSEFLANVSHELRTPLNAIVGFIDLLRDGVYGELSARQVGPVARVASSANHLRHLVDQVLDIAKMAAGRFETHLETIDLRAFVLELVSEVEALVSERGLNFSIAINPTLPRVRTDPMHLRQILMNLLGNAVKFTPSGGVAVRARLVAEQDAVVGRFNPAPSAWAAMLGGGPGGTWIALQVADSGIGIAPNDQERIFEEFEQVDAGARGDSAQHGTGLGLAISRRLARLLGGDLTLQSELGKGSTFTVWLPVDAGDPAAEHDSEGRVASGVGHQDVLAPESLSSFKSYPLPDV